MSTGNLLCQLLTYDQNKKVNLVQVFQYGAFGFFVSVKYNN
jgi:hypothetical protein